MMKITTLILLLAISTNCLTQNYKIGMSWDWSGGYDFTENQKYKVKHDYKSTSLNNINMGLFARMKKNKVTYTLFGNLSISNLFIPDNQKNNNKNWDIEMNTTEYKTGTYHKTSSDMLYGHHNPYYYESYSRSYEANVFTATNNLGLTARYDITENFGLGLGLNLGFTKYVMSVMDVSATYKGYDLDKHYYTLDRIETLKEAYDFWEIKPSIPVSVSYSSAITNKSDEKIEIYLSANVGQDFTGTVGIRWDIVSK